MNHNIWKKIVCYDSLLQVPFREEKSVQLFRVELFEVTSFKVHTLIFSLKTEILQEFKGQLFSKELFDVLEFLQKTNELIRF